MSSRVLGLLVCLALVIGLTQLLRYGANWGELDSVAFLRAIRSVQEAAQIVPSSGGAYANGYGYQSLALFLAEMGGLRLGTVQLLSGALLLAWVVLPAWLACRELTRSALAASLATLILLAQPDFVFPLLRGTHEKFTRGLMFVCLYLLLRSLHTRSPRQLGFFVVSFYLCTYALISFNNLLGSSFITAVGLALLLVWIYGRFFSGGAEIDRRLVGRLGYVVASMLVVAFVFTFYTYPPAQYQITLWDNVIDRLVQLFLQVEESSTNPYTVVSLGWISRPVYFAVSLANWLLLGGSVIVWWAEALRWLRQRQTPPRHVLLLWAFYAAFIVQGVVSMLIDISGAIARNLQHRAFPTFVMLAAPLAAYWLAQKLQAPQGGRLMESRVLRWGLGASMAVVMLLSMFKATVEPALSNYWTFYTPGEFQAVAWSEKSLPEAYLWVGFSERVAVGYTLRTDAQPSDIYMVSHQNVIGAHDFLLSKVTLLHASRLAQPLPVQVDSLITYDNGDAQVHHQRPVTPFQK